MKPLVRNILLISAIVIVAGVTILFRFVLAEPAKVESESVIDEKLPTFYEFGSTVCKPCKMMKPVLAELKKDYKGILNVIFHDTNIDKNKKYEVVFKFDEEKQAWYVTIEQVKENG